MNSASAFLADALDLRAPSPPAGQFLAGAAKAWPIAILGVPFDRVTLDEAVARIDAMIASRQPDHVVTAGIDSLVQDTLAIIALTRLRFIDSSGAASIASADRVTFSAACRVGRASPSPRSWHNSASAVVPSAPTE